MVLIVLPVQIAADIDVISVFVFVSNMELMLSNKVNPLLFLFQEKKKSMNNDELLLSTKIALICLIIFLSLNWPHSTQVR